MYLLHVPVQGDTLARPGGHVRDMYLLHAQLRGEGDTYEYVSPRSYRTRVHRRDSQMKKTHPVTRSEPSGLSWRVDL
jgi:hypothetical protein